MAYYIIYSKKNLEYLHPIIEPFILIMAYNTFQIRIVVIDL